MKNTFINNFVFCIIAFLIWALLAFNTNTADRSNYELFYSYALNGIRYPGVEIGFYYLMYFCSKLSLPFQGFLIIYSSIGSYILLKSISRYAESGRNIILLFFLYFPYLNLIVVLRNYMAAVIIIWAIQYLTYKSKSAIIKYCICVFIASCFHILAITYLVFLICYFPYNKVKKISLGCLIIGVFLLLTGLWQSSFIIQLIPKLNVYLSSGMNGTRSSTKFFLCIYYFCKLFFCYYCVPREKNSIIQIIRKIQLISIVFFPLCLIEMDFIRLEYNLFILLSVYIYNYIKEKFLQNELKQDERIITLCYISYYFISGYFLLYLFSYQSVVKTILTNNLLL